ncbi:molybdopterin cofactor-binding domain-containing protein [endosymbiont 'TC1' of Trimyema compressum]|uniref:molybdopterin cofactor-binding domain-containing protein n=1 Tax=endosymbiont 'TC1' of Trimyema compressum TaxID=243899 RepID=UPI00316AC1A1
MVDPYDIDPISNLSLGNAAINKCLIKGAEAIDWNRLKKRPKEDSEYYYGHGVAVSLHGNGIAPFAPDLSVMTLALNEDGIAIYSTRLCDHGGGTNTLLKKIVSEIVDIDRDLIKLITTDTYCTPYDFIAGASRNTWVGGNCAIKLCEHIKNELLETASMLLEVPQNTIIMENGFL